MGLDLLLCLCPRFCPHVPFLAGLNTAGTTPLTGCADEEKHLVHNFLMPEEEAEGWGSLRLMLGRVVLSML